jgi:membrane associated rhomboid family serine protease
VPIALTRRQAGIGSRGQSSRGCRVVSWLASPSRRNPACRLDRAARVDRHAHQPLPRIAHRAIVAASSRRGAPPSYLPREARIHAPETTSVTPVVRVLLIANVAAFVLQSMLPGLANAFVFVPALALVRPWTVVTYMFLHGDLMHLLFNMLALFFFAPRVEERIFSRPFAILYFLSGITGALLSVVFSPGSPIIGASGGVFGVMLAFAWFWPHEKIFIWGVLPVPARVLVILTTVLALWSGFGGVGGGIAHFAHLGGYLGAFLYLRWLDRKRLAFKRAATTAPPDAVQRVAGYKAIDLASVHEVNREEVNRILDKISAQGLGSLTPRETTFLSGFVPPDDNGPKP